MSSAQEMPDYLISLVPKDALGSIKDKRFSLPLGIHERQDLGDVVPDATTIIFISKGPIPEALETTNINIESQDKTILLHISMRPSEGVIVFNSRGPDQAWPELGNRVPLGDLLQQTDLSIFVRVYFDGFEVRIGESIKHTFKHRKGLGDRTVNSVWVGCPTAEKSILGSSVDVLVITHPGTLVD